MVCCLCGVLFEWWRGRAGGGARYTRASGPHPYVIVVAVTVTVNAIVVSIFASFAVSTAAVQLQHARCQSHRGAVRPERQLHGLGRLQGTANVDILFLVRSPAEKLHIIPMRAV